MKKMLIAALVAFITPIMLQAGGIGIYIPQSMGIEGDGTHTNDSYYYNTETESYEYEYENDYTYTLKKKSGIGIALATNLGKDSMFGYRFALEYTQPQREGDEYSSDRYDMIHTFEFGIVRSKFIGIWLGPRINVGVETYDNGYFDRNGVEFGLAPVLGINLNFGPYLAITLDVDYKFATQVGSTTSGTYDESVTGSTARLALFLKFGEQYSAYDTDYSEKSNGWD